MEPEMAYRFAVARGARISPYEIRGDLNQFKTSPESLKNLTSKGFLFELGDRNQDPIASRPALQRQVYNPPKPPRVIKQYPKESPYVPYKPLSLMAKVKAGVYKTERVLERPPTPEALLSGESEDEITEESERSDFSDLDDYDEWAARNSMALERQEMEREREWRRNNPNE